MTDAKKDDAKGKATENGAEKVEKKEVDILEADDLFEEFGNEEWHAAKDDESVPLWEADWEDENVADDFTGRLKAEVERGVMKD
ncbi:hypothetical protein HYH03_014300 [Edaphochlamys debaryana]|uniref:26S proteasome complex subunit SEM1 n=1 Tax=Edaphochlamys debaryana TaxID=47281 RepID=A0A835XWG6_9CHLO|nr:hypothetical protein HYH03_014300 [Edaphochlamys debaryana]|eukprot:KAG2487054.1 hypothetical protein HYH03_014300 [Edaphochlamys debaryana]